MFDGFPRTVAQAQYLGELLKQHGFKQPVVVHFVIDPALLMRRITGRRMCKTGGEIYNIYDRPPKVDGRLRHGRRRVDAAARRSRRNCGSAAARRTRSRPRRWSRITGGWAGCTMWTQPRASKRWRGGCWRLCTRRSKLVSGKGRLAETRWRFIYAARKNWKRCIAPGLIVHEVLTALRAAVKPGVTTMDLEKFAEQKIAGKPGKPAFKGYRGYPCSLCTSVNGEIVHGIPSPKRKLREGDIVSIDFGMEVDGYYADSAVTVPVGQIRPGAAEVAGCHPRIAGPRH